jgi:hypothetical protein
VGHPTTTATLGNQAKELKLLFNETIFNAKYFG